MEPEGKTFSTRVGDKEFILETGRLAGQASGAVTVRVGDTMVFAAATMSDQPRQGIDFFPLTVDYEELMDAGRRIPGSFFRREGRPSEEAILVARLTDRPLRPLFPKDLRNDVQVILYSFSADTENPIDIPAVNAASAALTISDIPWGEPDVFRQTTARAKTLGLRVVLVGKWYDVDSPADLARIANDRDARGARTRQLLGEPERPPS